MSDLFRFFYPHQKWLLRSRLSAEQVEAKLQQMTEPRKTFRISLSFLGKDARKPFEGVARNKKFRINRILQYRNSFRPVINGKIEASTRGSLIHLTMELEPFVWVFIAIWLLGVSLFAVAVSINWRYNGQVDFFAFVPVLMLTFGAALAIFGFRYECNKAKQLLAEILEANVEAVGK